MKRIMFFISLFMILTSCPKNEESKAVVPVDHLYGSWIFNEVGSTSYKTKGFTFTISENGKFSIIHRYAEIETYYKQAKVYYRLSSGTFTRNGNILSFKYDYETCSTSSKTEEVQIEATDERLAINISNSILIFTRSNGNSDPEYQIQLIEDKECKILSKLIKKSNREIASEEIIPSIFKKLQ